MGHGECSLSIRVRSPELLVEHQSTCLPSYTFLYFSQCPSMVKVLQRQILEISVAMTAWKKHMYKIHSSAVSTTSTHNLAILTAVKHSKDNVITVLLNSHYSDPGSFCKK